MRSSGCFPDLRPRNSNRWPASREQLRNGVKARQQKAIDTLAGDLLIAAVATEQNATIVTENTDDFEPFDGVSVEGYRGE